MEGNVAASSINSLSRDFRENRCFVTSRAGEPRLDIHATGGKRVSLPYSYLQDIVLSQTDDGEMIELHNPGVYFVQIQGRHLLPLYDALNRGCVKSVRPVKGSTEEGDGETHVTAIAAIALAYPEEQIESAYNS